MLQFVFASFYVAQNDNYGWLFFESVRIVLLPVPAVAAHFFDAEFSLPTQFSFCLGWVAIASSDVTRTTWLDGIRNRNTIGFFECLHYIQYRVTMACTDIVDSDTLVFIDSLQSSYVSTGKVNYVDIVAYTCTIVSVVVITEYTEFSTLTYS